MASKISMHLGWMDFKILTHKLEEKSQRTQIFQQVLLNLKIRYKKCCTLNWVSRPCEDTLGFLQ